MLKRMASKISRKRKQVLVRLAEGMRQKKASRNIEESADNLDESLQLPGPSIMILTVMKMIQTTPIILMIFL